MRLRRSDIAAIAIFAAALGLAAWAFARARTQRPALASTSEPAAPPDAPIAIPAGRFDADPRDWDVPGTRVVHVELDAFAIDGCEVTQGAWARCIERGACPTIEGLEHADRPVTRVSADEARAYCLARGGDLPTSTQFGRAAGGPAGARFPWGDIGPVCSRAAWGRVTGPCAFGEHHADPVGVHPDGATTEGVHDLAGNVAEWVRSRDDALVDDTRANDTFEIRGGSYRDDVPTALKTWVGRAAAPGDRFDDVGFRCVYPARTGGLPASPSGS